MRLLDNCMCERHFRPEDMLYPELLINDLNEKLTSLIPLALPKSINATQSASNAKSLAQNKSNKRLL